MKECREIFDTNIKFIDVSKQADLMTIGEYVCKTAGCDNKRPWEYACIGYEYMEENLTGLHDTMKSLLIGFQDVRMAQYLLSSELLQDEVMSTRSLNGVINESAISFSIYRNMNQMVCKDASEFRWSEENNGFDVLEFREYAPTFIAIDAVISMKPGAGKLSLEFFKGAFAKIPIVLAVGYLFYGDYEMHKQGAEPYSRSIEGLSEYYTKIGFVKVNQIIGAKGDKCVMCCPNGYRFKNASFNQVLNEEC